MRGAAFTKEIIGEHAERTEVHIGRETADTFAPSFELRKWDEVRLTITPRMRSAAPADRIPEIAGGKITYRAPKEEMRFYDLPASDALPDGGYEVEWVLNEKPDSNQLVFDLETENLEFFYQPIYTDAEIAAKASEGDFVSRDAMGSYAVYYKNLPRNDAGGKLYRTGKVGQIYRPRIDDAAGNVTYGDLSIDTTAGTLTVSIPQDFLDHATYPIAHASGLTFGYSSIGASSITIENSVKCYRFTMGTNAGTVDSMTIYSNPSSTARTMNSGIYLQSDLSFVTNGTGPTLTPSASGAAWRTTTYTSKPSLSGGIDYLLCANGSSGSGTHVVYYDAGTANYGYTKANTFPTYPNPMTTPTQTSNKYSIYATYSPVPDPPTNVAATDGTYTNKVTVTWTQVSGATGYRVYRNGFDVSGVLGDVATYDDTGAGAPSITPGSAVASDGTSTAQVELSVSGASANNGSTSSYYVHAINAVGDSANSSTDNGYIGVGSLTYQWQRSSGDSDASYSDLSGATASTYNDTGAPAPTITAGNASATDGTYSDKVALSVSGASANSGSGRYYRVVLNATGASQQTSTANRGYIGVGSLTYQWQRSAADSDASYSNISGATTASYDDTGAPADGSGRYYKVVEDATGASQQTSTADRGYRQSGSISTDIVNGSYASVGSPSVAMNSATSSLTCQTVTGTFGTASQQIYVNNNNGANNGWTLTVAASASTAVWDSIGTDYDFNDPTSSGCTDGGDADAVGGQTTLDPSGATLAVGQCGACSTSNVSKGSSSAFNQGITDSITLLTATAASDDVGDWTLQGVSISQKIPAEQPAASDYDINMVLTVTAS